MATTGDLDAVMFTDPHPTDLCQDDRTEQHRLTCAQVDAVVDGRVLRGLRNRQALMDAFYALAGETGAIPKAADVAERAGLSVRSLFQHFNDLEELRSAVVETRCQQALDHVLVEREIVDLSQPVEQRVETILRSRVGLWEMLEPLRQTLLLREGLDESAHVRDLLEELRIAVRSHLQLYFAAELHALQLDDDLVLTSFQLSTSAACWDNLRLVHGYDVDTTIAIMRHMALSVLRSHTVASDGAAASAPRAPTAIPR